MRLTGARKPSRLRAFFWVSLEATWLVIAMQKSSSGRT